MGRARNSSEAVGTAGISYTRINDDEEQLRSNSSLFLAVGLIVISLICVGVYFAYDIIQPFEMEIERVQTLTLKN
jgi:hypothetical protein